MSNLMDETVKEICDSMLNNPNRWLITTHTLDDCVSGVKYWIDPYNDESITQIWNGSSRDTVFTKEQGKLIRNAFFEMRKYKASEAQLKVMESMKPKPLYILYEVDSQRKWWEFWK